MKRLMLAAMLVAMLIMTLALPALGNHPPTSDNGVDIPNTGEEMNHEEFWENYFGGQGYTVECTKFNNHSGSIPSSYEAAVVKSGSDFVRVYWDPPAQVIGPLNPTAQHPNRRHTAPFSWVMKCNFEEDEETTTTTLPEEDTTTSTLPEEETTTTVPEEETTTTTLPPGEPETFCVDPNTATINELEQVPGIDFQTALAIVNTTSFDSQFESVAEVQATFGLGDEVLTGTEENPGFFDDSCLTFVSSEEPTTTTTAAPTTTGSNPTTTDPTLLPFTGPEEDQRMFALSASGLILLGLALVASARRSRSE